MRFRIILSLALLVISACTNWKEEPAISKIIFINALPGSSEATLLFDGQPLNSTPLPYGTFTEAYQNLRAGRRIISAKLSANSDPTVIDTLYIPEFKNYTAYFTQDTSKNSEGSVFYFYQDVLTRPASGKANVRFMNLYPDKNAKLDVLISGRTDTLFKNQTFGSITNFVATDTSSTYVFRLLNNKKPISGLSDTISLSRQFNYTILVTDESSTGTVIGKPKLQRIMHQ
jgi:hypothetical protein